MRAGSIENPLETRPPGRRRAGALLVLLCLAQAAFAGPYSFENAPRIVAISDPHGAYDAMVLTLRHADILDESGDWSGADTHLVITGDMLDRGADSRRIMDLVMQLEEQAATSGGRVHLLLGNHEVMNLVGDTRYVAPAEFAAFADEEKPEERERWFRLYAAEHLAAGETDEAALRARFDEERPPGFYGHRAAFAADGYYGRWLLQKPLVVVINGNAFVHGGLPPLVAELGLTGLNDKLRSDVVDYVTAIGILGKAGLLDPEVNFYEHANLAAQIAAMTGPSDDVGKALQTIIDLSGSDVHGPAGPLWYRGNVGCSALIESDRLDASLAAIGASRVIIGHTPTLTRDVLQRYDGRVIEIDTGMLTSAYKGSGHALIIDKDEVWVASEKSADLERVAPHPRRVGFRPDNLSTENLEHLLASGEIVAVSTDERKREIVDVRGGGVQLKAVFVRDENRRGMNFALAAYRLDRLIGLEMVPVTVAREVDGNHGALQYLPDNMRDEQERVDSRQGAGAWCPLQDQWNAMYIFDAWIYNPGRAPSNMLYNLENWQMILAGFDGTFGTRGGRPKYLEQAPLDITGEWRRQLAALDAPVLQKALGNSLEEKRIGALLKRRDDLLAN